jgi:O-antigen/teichoic acid export membrane protein
MNRSGGTPAAQGIFSLGLANALAMLISLAAAALYAHQLDAAQLAAWATALAVARAGLLVLDGGLKTALVRRADAVHADTTRQLVRLSGALAIGMTAAAAGVAWQYTVHAEASGAALLLVIYAAAYWLSYPPMLAPLAGLERSQQFAVIGRAEGSSLVLEFALPAVLLALGVPFWLAFASAAVMGRALRCAWLVRHAPPPQSSEAPGAVTGSMTVIKEGLGVQAVAGLSMLRDQMHLWLLAPWFGAAWAGQYAMALMACALCVQVGAQTVSRVALPALRQMSDDTRWTQVVTHTRWLAIITLPPLVLLPMWLAHGDQAWWQGRWATAVLVVPWLAARMMPGVVTTALGSWLMVSRSPACNAAAHALWTAGEILLAIVAMQVWGPLGLAIAAAFTPWLAVVLMVTLAAPGEALAPRLTQLARLLLGRPSLWLAALLALAALAQGQAWALLLGTLCLPVAWLTEGRVRQWLKTLLIATTAHATRVGSTMRGAQP